MSPWVAPWCSTSTITCVVDLYNQAAHDVDIEPGSRLAKILGNEVVGVNSLHHQVIDQLGRGVRAVAHNHDGQVEAIELDSAPAVFGVQWHPELLRHRGDHLALFDDLVQQVLALPRDVTEPRSLQAGVGDEPRRHRRVADDIAL